VSAIAVTMALASFAQAQTAPSYQQGLQGRKVIAATLRAKSGGDAGSSDTTQLLPALSGIVIVSNPSAVQAGGVTAAGPVQAQVGTIPKSVQSAAAKFVGKPVSLASLDQMTKAMVLAYRAEGLPVVNIAVPPQDITNGVLQVIAVVGKLGAVSVEGGSKPAASYTKGFSLAKGDAIAEGPVLNHLTWQSRRFNKRVDATYAPGAAFGETDLAFTVTETAPRSYFVGADTSGNGGVGNYRIFGGFAINDFGGRTDHEVTGQITTSEKLLNGLAAVTLGYSMPVTDQSDLNLSGTYARSSTTVGAFDQKGTSVNLSAAIQTQLPRGNQKALDLTYGIEIKRADSTVEFGGPVVTNNNTDIAQIFARLGGQMVGEGSSLQYYAGVWVSPGGLTANNSDAQFDATRSGAMAQYGVLRASFNYSKNLPKDWRLGVNGSMQYANARLLPSESFYLGGLDSVRGFDDGVTRGDKGLTASIEVYGPNMNVKNIDAARVFAFVDAGSVMQVNAAGTEPDQSAVAGGLGLNVDWSQNTTLESSLGWPISATNVTKGDGPVVNLRLVSRF
jgi:hemolysin activation/secretion protein